MLMLYLHRGCLYREALTPQQKQLKKDYLLEQQQGSDWIPTFEEIWKYAQGGYTNQDIDNERETAIDEEILGWMNEQGMDAPYDPPDDVAYGSDEYDEWEAGVQLPLIEKYRDEVERYYALEVLKARVRRLYDGAVKRVTQWLDGQPCWRVQPLVASLDPAEHPQVGVHWTFDENSDVLDYIATESDVADLPGAQIVVYHARIDLQYVNKAETIWANIIFGVGEEGEQEVRFYRGAPIWVYDVQLPDGTVLEINDWRRC